MKLISSNLAIIFLSWVIVIKKKISYSSLGIVHLYSQLNSITWLNLIEEYTNLNFTLIIII